MNTTIILLKMLIYGIIGYYITPKKYHLLNGPLVPSFSLFSLIIIFSDTNNLIYLFIEGILFAFLIKTFISIISDISVFNENLVYFGIFNVICHYTIEPLINFFINNSSSISVLYLFIVILIISLFDITFLFKFKN